jgi:hypothetical protein
LELSGRSITCPAQHDRRSLQLIAEESLTPPEILRNSIINFGALENYLRRFDTVVAVGASAGSCFNDIATDGRDPCQRLAAHGRPFAAANARCP